MMNYSFLKSMRNELIGMSYYGKSKNFFYEIYSISKFKGEYYVKYNVRQIYDNRKINNFNQRTLSEIIHNLEIGKFRFFEEDLSILIKKSRKQKIERLKNEL